MSKSTNEAYDLLEEMAMNNYQWPSERETTKKVAGVHEMDAISMLSTQVATLTKQLQQNNIQAQVPVMQMHIIKTRSSIRSLETQIGQLATLMENRAQGNFPSTTEVNPKGNLNEHCHAITLRSGTVYEGTSMEKRVEQKQDQQAPNIEDKKTCEEKVIENPPAGCKEKRLQKNRLDKQFGKFLEVFKRLHINIPFAEALEQMPSYVKFMKDILSKKRKMEDYETVALTEECSAILQRKLPQKLRDPGSFTIPYTIGNFECKHALCDLRANINLMPLSVFKRLGLGEAKPTTVTLQLADRSLAHPRGIIEDVLVKVDKFIFPADFIVLDMEEDANVPIILGRPFLATRQALIEVQKGELKLRVKGDEVVCSVFKAMTYPMASDSCYSVDVIDKAVLERRVSSDALEAVLTSGKEDDDDEEMKEYVKWINSYHPYMKKFEELAEATE
ncbi:uncharacterized protein LOC133793767 [Humulus lupulus]|uniref:uncharacterized protein LOC133793767 n=1 Tax=Humulus lupulus TaxID=3486 RepID=UPI002B416AC2|nr:uncharacterized protein LOC133793767 [Humulus lupulus]